MAKGTPRPASAEAARKQADAKEIFLTGKFNQGQICDMLGISPNTLTRWKAEGGWDAILNVRKAGKEKLGDILLEQIIALDEDMKRSGRLLMNSKEVNQLWQLHNMLRKVEETGTAAAIIQSLTRFTDWIRQRHPDRVQGILAMADEYIMEQLKKEG